MIGYDVIILGAGASGLWSAMTAARRGMSVAVVDHGPKTARKVRVSGGGKCNFTNLNVTPANYVCANPHFVKSALARLSPWDVIGFLAENAVTHEERDHGQLFTCQGAGKVAGALTDRCRKAGAAILLGRKIRSVSGKGPFVVDCGGETLTGSKLVIALGAPPWPQVGGSDLGFRLARQYGLPVIEPRPGLVPLVFAEAERPLCAAMAGNALPATVETGDMRFTDPLLFTHKGISGPAVLQASNYWHRGQSVTIDFLPGGSVSELMRDSRSSKARLRTLLAQVLPKRLPPLLLPPALADTPVSRLSAQQTEEAAQHIHSFTVTPAGTAGFNKAEVCLGGVDTDHISSKTMEVKAVPGLHIIGETLDVTGHLGGFNLHWAFASGAACGQAV